jgi:2-phosphoglycolate phosphatase
MSHITTVLFDLDGTLLDTAPDLALALNTLRREHNLPDLPLADIRPFVGHGSRSLLKLGFNIADEDHDYTEMIEKFFTAYDQCLATSTKLFPGMDAVLTHLENNQMQWGIVTNKPARFTNNLLDALDLTRRSACTISGDTLAQRKPHPEPIIHACKLLKCQPENTLYIGDTVTDIIASKAAGTLSLAALYGYLSANEDPFEWQADGYIKTSDDIMKWL